MRPPSPTAGSPGSTRANSTGLAISTVVPSYVKFLAWSSSRSLVALHMSSPAPSRKRWAALSAHSHTFCCIGVGRARCTGRFGRRAAPAQ
eukprot:9257158-Lingulodinium_polyedra.AAC.1